MFFLLSSTFARMFFLLSYVSTGKSFPKPLSAEEEQKYIKLMEEGDEKARDILIEKNLRLVAHIAKKYNLNGSDADDLISIGTIGLIKSINTFKNDKGIRLATYAARCIENEILMAIRSSKKNGNEVSLEEPIGVDKEGNEISFLDIVCSIDDDVIDSVEMNEKTVKLYKFIDSSLSEREKTIIVYRYGIGDTKELTQKEIAGKLNISRSYVSRIEKKAIEKLRKRFEEYCNENKNMI